MTLFDFARPTITMARLSEPVCLVQRSPYGRKRRPGRVRHRVEDVQAFCELLHLSKSQFARLLAGELRSYDGWQIVPDCPCDEDD